MKEQVKSSFVRSVCREGKRQCNVGGVSHVGWSKWCGSGTDSGEPEVSWNGVDDKADHKTRWVVGNRNW